MSVVWRVEQPCDNCPFNADGPGLHLRRSLQPGRFKEITDGLKNGQAFHCHKTTHETGDGTMLVCAGSLNWQNARGYSSNLQRVMARIAYLSEKGTFR